MGATPTTRIPDGDGGTREPESGEEGPAPGINRAISTCTIEAINSGRDAVDIYDGFAH